MGVERPTPDDSNDEPELKPVHFFFPYLTPEESKRFDHESVLLIERRQKVIRMVRERKSYREIKDTLNISLGTVSNDVQAVMNGYMLIAARDAKEHIAEMLARLDHREQQIERAWDKSLGELVETSDTRRKTAAGAQDVSVVKQKERTGNPMYSAQLLAIWDRRARLLGLLSKNDLAAEGRAVELQQSRENALAGMSDSEIENEINKIVEGIRPATTSGAGEGEATSGT